MSWMKKIFTRREKRMPQSVNDQNFKELVVESDLPAIVDVWSSGCGPCVKLESVMVELATRFGDQVRICEMNVAGAPRACTQLNVRATPTVIYFEGGREIERVRGFRSSLYHAETIAEMWGIKD
jgi:thioredoxin-like negative regulator of GroEL